MRLREARKIHDPGRSTIQSDPVLVPARRRARGGAVTTTRQRDANRRNARSSTGPRTSAGKARAAQNARRHGLSLPARYDPSRFGEIEALARAIAGAGADAERLELARRIAEAQIDIIRARSARRDRFPTSPAALLAPAAIARLAAIDRYEQRAWSRRKRAIRALDDARGVERTWDAAGHLAERSQLRQAKPSACAAPAPQAVGSPDPKPRARSDCPFGNLAERSQGVTFRVKTAAGTLAERSQREAIASKPAARHFGRTKPMATVTMAFSGTADRGTLRLRPCHRDGKGSRSPPLSRTVHSVHWLWHPGDP
jgi:hypothetical protein